MKKRWTKQEEQLLKDNYHKMSRQDLLKVLPNRSKASLAQKAKSLGLSGYSGNHSWHSTLSHNKKYFDVANISNSYWAGFITADGYIDFKNNKVRIKLSAKDKEQLIQLKSTLDFTGTVREYTRTTNYGKYDTCYLDICGASTLIKDLVNTFNVKQAPKLNNTLNELSYLKGLIDGDGSISKDGKTFEVICSPEIAKWIIKLGISLDCNLNIRDCKTSPHMKIVYKTDISFLNLIKNSSQFGLKRKWSRVPLASNS